MVIRTPGNWNECAVLSEGLVYQYSRKDVTASPRAQRSAPDVATYGWRSMFSQYMGNDCFHYPTRVENVNGLTYQYKKTGDSPPERYTDNRAVLWEYEYGAPAENDTWTKWISIAGISGNVLKEVWDSLHATEAYRSGWWAVLWGAPFPQRDYGDVNMPSHKKVGSLYGGTRAGSGPGAPVRSVEDSASDNNQKEVPSAPLPGPRPAQGTLDLFNLTYTASGKRGWNHDDSDTLGTIEGIAFYFNFDMYVGTIRVPAGDVPFRVVIYDTEDNVWISDFKQRFLGETQLIMLPSRISGSTGRATPSPSTSMTSTPTSSRPNFPSWKYSRSGASSSFSARCRKVTTRTAGSTRWRWDGSS